MFKINFKLISFSIKAAFFSLFFLIIISHNNYLYSDTKIYLDLAKVQYDHAINYKSYQTSSQILVKTELDKELKKWVKKKLVLKGNSGKLIVKITEEKIFDNFVQEHREKFSFLPKNGISYKIIFKVSIIAENTNNKSFAKIQANVNGDRTFLGSFSINERSKGLDESVNKMIKKLEKNLEDEINIRFKDFITNKYS